MPPIVFKPSGKLNVNDAATDLQPIDLRIMKNLRPDQMGYLIVTGKQ